MLRTIEKKQENNLCYNFQLTIKAPKLKVFEALTKNNIIDEWGGGPSRVQAKVHGDLSLWDGDVYGNIREIKSSHLLIYTMRHISWGNTCKESLLTWNLSDHPRGTLLEMSHKDLPSRKLRDIQEEFWASSFLGPLKAYLESFDY